VPSLGISCHIFELTLIVGSAGFLDPPFHRSVGLKAFGWGPASEIYSLCFVEKNHGIGALLEIDGFFGEQVSSRKLLSDGAFLEREAKNDSKVVWTKCFRVSRTWGSHLHIKAKIRRHVQCYFLVKTAMSLLEFAALTCSKAKLLG